MKDTLQYCVAVLVVSIFASKCLAQKGPAVEFTNKEKNAMSIALSGWNSDYTPAGPGESSLAVLPQPFQWVRGWYSLNPGETKRFNRDEGAFYFSLGTWENYLHNDRFTYFWVHKKIAFQSTERREKNQIVIVPIIGDQKPDPKDSASIPNRAQWGVQAGTTRGQYTNDINPKNSQTLRDNGWAPFPFLEVPSGTKSVIFQNGKANFLR